MDERELDIRENIHKALQDVLETYVGDKNVCMVWQELSERFDLDMVQNAGDIVSQLAVSTITVMDRE